MNDLETAVVCKDLVAKGLAGLGSRQRQIIIWRFGLDGEPACSREDCAAELRLSPYQVRQIEYAALRRMHQHLLRLPVRDLFADGAYDRALAKALKSREAQRRRAREAQRIADEQRQWQEQKEFVRRQQELAHAHEERERRNRVFWEELRTAFDAGDPRYLELAAQIMSPHGLN